MRKLWLVGSGYYSDRSEVCVCPTEEIATAVAAEYEKRHRRFEDDYWIDEIQLIDDHSEVTTRQAYSYVLSLDDELNVRSDPYEHDEIVTGFEWEPEGAEFHSPSERAVPRPPWISARSYASAEAARKAAYDKLAEARALRAGV